MEKQNKETIIKTESLKKKALEFVTSPPPRKQEKNPLQLFKLKNLNDYTCSWTGGAATNF